MCGIAGFVGARNDEVLRAMADSLRRRGPDGEGYHFCERGFVNLAHRRLSINDISGGHQPMWNEDYTIGIVFNGEIYNHRQLRDELTKRGHTFRSHHSDTEVLIHGYEEWGVRILDKLNGMFAFCIYDKRRLKLFIARDRFGEKPLYYSIADDKFIFASELGAVLLHPDVSPQVDSLAIKRYFAFGYVPAPQTFFIKVSKLPGGCYLNYDLSDQKLEIGRYWEFKVKEEGLYNRAAELDLAEELRSRLEAAVSRRLVADVPVGIFLSGGIDSSTVLACASAKGGGAKIKTFSIGFSEADFDESILARSTAHYFGSDHHEEILGIDTARNVSAEVLDALDEPIADSSILPTYLLSKFARRHVTVALGGDGGDELFAGYAPFLALGPSRFFSRVVPSSVRKIILGQINKIPASERYMSWEYKLKRAMQGLQYQESLWNPAWLAPLGLEEISELVGAPISPEEIYADAIKEWEASDSDNLIARTSEFYVKFYLQGGVLAKVDRASMMVGLEVRSPFLDNDVVEFATKLPAKYKINNGRQKYLLRLAMNKILPESILGRGKRGFAVPLAKWLKNWEIKEKNDLGCDSNFIIKAKERHITGARDERLFLWSWLVLMRYSARHILKNNRLNAIAKSEILKTEAL